MGKPTFRPALLKFLEQRDGATVYLDDIVKALGCTPTQAQGAMANIRTDLPDFPLRVLSRGQVWQYGHSIMPPKAVAVKRMFEEIAVTKNGDILIEDESGKIYRASEV